ncbi:SDR family oxidoreductase [Phytohabitans aurantiacus]|jgi:NAD(P)-dependent dehydrogenase (short-subunit alcohol dehydrogenase family)|uniref:Dehydrogenase n=1 Tax=Phytohabitans aurantiacus TaxID=3016789 RepID=A0ABQ5QWD3_9ACTN|nr:SDR family oxidoreductase [Phytohabitans aurantiacus]GLH98876.1 dehydrogenase [Phytohabitans aurantiacus]
MRMAGRVVVVTGGAGGIGAALARRFAAEGAEGVVVADIDGAAADAVAGPLGERAIAVEVDVADEDRVQALVAAAEARYGRIDLFCANAGITVGTGIEASGAEWARAWAVNVLSHVYAARAVLPAMLARGEGYLLHTCSAAGLLTAVGDAPYTVTKHAALGLAEWLAITYGDRGIRVSALCPQGVRTPMLDDGLAAGHVGALVTAASGAVLTPDEVADAVVDGLAAERFLILPHPEVASYTRKKAADPDAWLSAMRALAARADSP